MYVITLVINTRLKKIAFELQKLGFIAGRTFVTQIVIIYSILVITKKFTFIKKKIK